jgi:hypothetical protein
MARMRARKECPAGCIEFYTTDELRDSDQQYWSQKMTLKQCTTDTVKPSINGYNCTPLPFLSFSYNLSSPLFPTHFFLILSHSLFCLLQAM